MALTEITVAQQALGMLGITNVLDGTLVSSLAPAENVAEQQVLLWWETSRDTMLRAAPWSFATLGVPLVLDETAGSQSWAHQWTYTYEYPDDCYIVWGLLDRGRLAPKLKFVVRLNDAGEKRVFTDAYSPLHALIVTTDATDAATWPMDFGAGLAAMLAANMAMGLKADPLLRDSCLAHARMRLAEAWSSSALEGEPDGNQFSVYELARFGWPRTDG